MSSHIVTSIVLEDQDREGDRVLVDFGRGDCAAAVMVAYQLGADGTVASPYVRLSLDQLAQLVGACVVYLDQANWSTEKMELFTSMVDSILDHRDALADQLGVDEDDDDEDDDG